MTEERYSIPGKEKEIFVSSTATRPTSGVPSFYLKGTGGSSPGGKATYLI
jgi:hypothetical protein